MTKKNRGVLVRPRQPTDYIFGGSSIVYKVVNPTGDWPRPIGETQHSDVVDWMDCVSESMVHCIESQIEFLTGQKIKYSARFVAKMSGTTPQGNYQTAVADAIRKYGIPLEKDWPRPSDPNCNWDDYYTEIPQEVKDKALDFLKQWNFQYEFVNEGDVPKALKQAPLQAIITKEVPYHAQELVAVKTVFDTYPPYEKPLLSVYDYLKPLITPKTMPPKISTVVFADGKTLGACIDTPNGTQIVKATGEDQWRSWNKSDSYGLPTVNADGTTNWNAQYKLPF